MLTVSKISSLPSSTFLVQSKRIRERRGDNFRSLLAPPLSLLYTLLPVLNFLPVTVGRRGSRRRSGSRRGGGDSPLPRATFIIPLLSIVYFQRCHFQNVPLRNLSSPPPPLPSLFSHFLGTHISLFSVRLITLYSIFRRS